MSGIPKKITPPKRKRRRPKSCMNSGNFRCKYFHRGCNKRFKYKDHKYYHHIKNCKMNQFEDEPYYQLSEPDYEGILKF